MCTQNSLGLETKKYNIFEEAFHNPEDDSSQQHLTNGLARNAQMPVGEQPTGIQVFKNAVAAHRAAPYSTTKILPPINCPTRSCTQ
jgi:hypothetical protein